MVEIVDRRAHHGRRGARCDASRRSRGDRRRRRFARHPVASRRRSTSTRDMRRRSSSSTASSRSGSRTASIGRARRRWVYVPPEVVHTFAVTGDGPAHFLDIHVPSCGFGDFVRGLHAARSEDELRAVRAAFDQQPAPDYATGDPGLVVVRASRRYRRRSDHRSAGAPCDGARRHRGDHRLGVRLRLRPARSGAPRPPPPCRRVPRRRGGVPVHARQRPAGRSRRERSSSSLPTSSTASTTRAPRTPAASTSTHPPRASVTTCAGRTRTSTSTTRRPMAASPDLRSPCGSLTEWTTRFPSPVALGPAEGNPVKADRPELSLLEISFQPGAASIPTSTRGTATRSTSSKERSSSTSATRSSTRLRARTSSLRRTSSTGSGT